MFVDNIDEIFNKDQQLVTRSKKLTNQQKMKEIEEQQEKHQKRLSKLAYLEEDDYEKDENNDSDYDMDEDEESMKEKKKRNKQKTKYKKEIRFGKINVNKYFNYEKDNINYDFPNYNNIIVKPIRSKPTYKICDVCFGFANYTCKHCKDKYCSIKCYNIHKDKKCIKFIDE